MSTVGSGDRQPSSTINQRIDPSLCPYESDSDCLYIYIYVNYIHIYVLKCYICVDCIIFIYFSDMSIIHNYIIRLSIIDISLKYVHCSVILDMGLFESRVI